MDGMHAVEMEYQGRELGMMVIVPDDPQGLDALEQRLDAATFQRWVEAMHPTGVDVALPRFKIDPPQSLAVGSMLMNMGMRRAFTDDAEFGDIAQGESLKIAAVFHKAFVEVNEEGTEAAAATAVVIATRGMPGPQAERPRFYADHPFLFLLVDQRTGAVLFLGRVADPR